jgi:hypothetical protein
MSDETDTEVVLPSLRRRGEREDQSDLAGKNILNRLQAVPPYFLQHKADPRGTALRVQISHDNTGPQLLAPRSELLAESSRSG